MAGPTQAGMARGTRGELSPQEFHSDTGNGTWAERMSYGTTGFFTIRTAAATTVTTTFTTNSPDFNSPPWARGLWVYLNVSTVTAGTSGTTTIGIEVQGKDPQSGDYISLSSGGWMIGSSSGAVAPMNVVSGATGSAALQIYPGVVNSTGRSVSAAVPGIYRVQSVIAGTSVILTFGISGQYEP